MKEQIEKINNQANNIETNLNYIKENISKNKEPIFIELIGTAKSGKTTLLNNITKLLTKNGIPVQKRAETAEYNPIENKDLEEYNIWMYSELIKNLSEDMSDNTPRVVIYDRGMLDRLPWIDFSVNDAAKNSFLFGDTGSDSATALDIIVMRSTFNTSLALSWNVFARLKIRQRQLLEMQFPLLDVHPFRQQG